MKIWAKVVSRIFDPIIEVPVILMGVASMAYLNGYRWRFLTLLFFLDAVIPGMVFFYLWGKKNFKDFDFHDKKDRLPLFLTTVLAHGVGVMVAYLIDRHPLAEILLVLWLLAVIFTLVTLVWKISIHAGVNTTLAMLIVLLLDMKYWWVFLVPLLVSYARIVDKDHSIWQVVVGMLVPVAVISLLFQVFGVVSLL